MVAWYSKESSASFIERRYRSHSRFVRLSSNNFIATDIHRDGPAEDESEKCENNC